MNQQVFNMLMDTILDQIKKDPSAAVALIKELYTEYKATEVISGAMELINMVAKDFDATMPAFEDRRAESRMRVFKKYLAVGFTEDQALQIMANDAANTARSMSQVTSGIKATNNK